MPTVREVCQHVRSKNAGPFWITIDLSFKDQASFDAWSHAPQFEPAAIAALYGVDAGQVKRFWMRDLSVLKISYARHEPQGGRVERDMHGGQQYVRLLDVELDPALDTSLAGPLYRAADSATSSQPDRKEAP
ncbi:MAG: hypothetical protein JWQ11_1572 [Rhizobacter sp.]|nr:hypothetical protein [Rhizobacter sp.]